MASRWDTRLRKMKEVKLANVTLKSLTLFLFCNKLFTKKKENNNRFRIYFLSFKGFTFFYSQQFVTLNYFSFFQFYRKEKIFFIKKERGFLFHIKTVKRILFVGVLIYYLMCVCVSLKLFTKNNLIC